MKIKITTTVGLTNGSPKQKELTSGYPQNVFAEKL
jgi:hypothetical protein